MRGELTDDDLDWAAEPTIGSALHQLRNGYTRQRAEQEFNRRFVEVIRTHSR